MSDDFGLRDYLAARFDAIDERLAGMDRRFDRIEQAGPKAGAYGAIGTALGGAIVAVLAYFGVKPEGR